MTPLSLTLEHFIGIRDGLGRDSITFDLAALFGDAQLIAIKGPNGRGKTTFFDSLVPQRFLPSRVASYSPGSFSYYDHVYGTEAAKTLIWAHDGVTYRTSLRFRMTNKTQKTEAYLAMRIGDKWAPVKLADGTKSNSSTKTYDACVNASLGSPETFFTSVFSAQNRKPLSAYTNGDVKSLLTDLLGLDAIAETGARAKRTRDILRTNLDGLRVQIGKSDELDSHLEQEEQFLGIAREKLTAVIAEKPKAKSAIDEKREALESLRALARDQIETEKRRAELQQRITTVRCDAHEVLDQISTDIKDARRRRDDAAAACKTIKQTAQQRIDAQGRRIVDAEQKLELRPVIELAKEELPGFKSDEKTAVSELAESRAQAEAITALRAEFRTLIAERNGLKRDGVAAKSTLESLTVRAELTERVPCQGTDLQPRCELLAEAMTAKGKIPETAACLEKHRNDYVAIDRKLKAINDEIDASPNPDIQGMEIRIADLRDKIRAAETLIAKESTVDQAAAIIHEARAAIEAIEVDRDDAVTKAEAETSTWEDVITKLGDRIAAVTVKMQADESDLEKAIATLPDTMDGSQIKAAEQAVTAAETELEHVEQRINRLHADVAGHESSIDAYKAQIAELAPTIDRVERLEIEIANWNLLADACGPNGIIALEIDDAGPTIAEKANSLLESCYGYRFSLRIETQSTTKKGNTSEGFDILVYDTESDSEKSLKVMSGGERIWIQEAITRAIALYLADRSGRRYETLFLDESDGPLDSDKKERFIRMLRTVIEIGGYRRGVFISHTPALWDLADKVIDMDDFLAVTSEDVAA